MLPRLIACTLVFVACQDTSPPPAGPQPSPLQRYVDFSADLEQASVSVHIGRLAKLREGKRERITDGMVGGGAQVAVSGTQFFKVEATGTMNVQEVLCGIQPTMVTLQLELQVVRLPDGSERRQVRMDHGDEVGEGTLALWVFEPMGNKGQRLLHVIPFDPRVDDGAEAERVFAERMRDVFAVNSHVRGLRRALAAVDAAKDGEARSKALAALRELVGRRPELQRPEDVPLLAVQVAPLEERCKQRLATAGGGK